MQGQTGEGSQRWGVCALACAFGKGIVTEEKHVSHSGSNLGGTAGERLQPHMRVVGSQAARVSVSGLGPF